MKRGEETLRELLAPIQHLLKDPKMVEIVTQRECEVGYERGGEWHWEHIPEFTYRRLDAIGLVAGQLMSKDFDAAHPICLTTLPDGERFTLCRSPVTDPNVIAASIRCAADNSSFSATYGDDFDHLFRHAQNNLDRSLSDADRELRDMHKARAWREFFPLAVKSRKTIGATGIVRSGKTRFLRQRLMTQIDSEDRLITIEDTPEFKDFPHIRNRVSLYFGAARSATAEDCFEATLRMRPSRVALQELRGAEVMAFIRLQASGHAGSLTTWHADEKDPFTPLVLMAKTSPAGQHFPEDKLETMLRGFIDIVVNCYFDERTKDFEVPSVYFRGAQ